MLAMLMRQLGSAVTAIEFTDDHEQLRRFIASGDSTAFEVLVWRHAPMVLGLCRRMLRNTQDAEDAFQAVFLTLSRKAASIRRRQSLGAWLHQVAYRMALRQQTRQRRRPLLPLPDDTIDPGITTAGNDSAELKIVLDAEIARLTDRLRVPFVLRYLNGWPVEQVAQELRVPKGTILSRLARARERLRVRLERRGLALTSEALLCGLVEQAGAETVPPALVKPLVTDIATKGGVLFSSPLSPAVLNLSDGAIRAMSL